MAHQIKDYSSIGGLMLHATHGSEQMAAVMQERRWNDAPAPLNEW